MFRSSASPLRDDNFKMHCKLVFISLYKIVKYSIWQSVTYFNSQFGTILRALDDKDYDKDTRMLKII